MNLNEMTLSKEINLKAVLANKQEILGMNR